MKISPTMPPCPRAELALASHRQSLPTPKQTLRWKWWLRTSFEAAAFLSLAALVATSAVLIKEAKHVPSLAAVDAWTLAQAPAREPSAPSTQPIAHAQPTSAVRPVALTPDVYETPAPSKSGAGTPSASRATTPASNATPAPTDASPAKAEKVWPAGTRWFNGRPVRPARTITMVVTAYSPDWRSCGDSADGLTATLHSVYTNGHELVAADPKVLPYGSMITVPGYADNDIVPVLDCGGAIKGKRLDVLFPTHNVARRWGVQKLNVTVWEYADGKPRDNPRKLR